MTTKVTGLKLNNKDVIAKILELRGNLAAVARALGVSRDVVYAYIERHPKAQQALVNARETMLDNAESVLYSRVLSGEDTTALIFFLKTQGKSRGYTESFEVTMKRMPDEDLRNFISQLAAETGVLGGSAFGSEAPQLEG